MSIRAHGGLHYIPSYFKYGRSTSIVTRARSCWDKLFWCFNDFLMDSFVNKDADLNSAKAEALANASRSVAGYLQVCI